ncbi:amidohydrolase family protein [Chloroflexi bacterium]|nr:amidohydrolase family protein [Chloroflexota bacterium]|tara:strand:- start:3306 stop:4571 length:1266 start_codon:yes stop_codon:yes gene_type:complete
MDNKESNMLVIQVGELIDGISNDTKKNISIIINGNSIVDIKPTGELAIPTGLDYKLIDYSDKTILPGLIDSHVHLTGIGDGRSGDQLAQLPDEVLSINMANNAKKHLHSGVTTVRDCGAKNDTAFHLRTAAQMGIIESPRLVLSGRPLAIIGGHLSYFGEQITGTNECRAAVRYLIKQGADFIKVTASGGSTNTSFPLKPSFSQEELNVIVEEAHKFGKHVAAHCHNSESMVRSLKAGVDTIIHGVFKESDGTNKYREDVVELMLKNNTFVNPTLAPGMMRVKIMENKKNEGNFSESNQEEMDKVLFEHEYRMECFNKMYEAGISMSAGSDSAWGAYEMGNFFLDIEGHVAGGQSPMEAIKSATSVASQSCWIDDSIGSIEIGKLADMIVLDESPVNQIENLRTISEVIKDGEFVDRNNLL